jgi:CHASE2 domain-containing sensor protein
MNTYKIRNIWSFVSPSRSKLALFARITLFLAFFGTVCYLVAGWNLLRAIPAGIITAFLFMLVGECVLKILILVTLLYQRREEKKEI